MYEHIYKSTGKNKDYELIGYTFNAESYNLRSQYLRSRYYDTVKGNFLTENSYFGDIHRGIRQNRISLWVMCMTITARFPGCQMILHMDRSIITLQPVLPGTTYPSSNDMQVLSYYSQLGSPQKISEIIPIGKTGTVKFGVNGIK